MAGKKTLVVDDSMSTRMMTAAQLGALCPDWSVVQAKDGNDAIAKSEECEFEACLIDVNMPGMDGFEVAEIMRQKFPAAHICMLTANIQAKVQDRAADAGYQFIAKPVTSDKLEAFVAASNGGE